MTASLRLIGRFLPSVVMAVAVTFLAAGLLSYAAVPASGDVDVAGLGSGTPPIGREGAPTSEPPTDTAGPDAETEPPAVASPASRPSLLPGASGAPPGPSASAPSAQPSASPSPTIAPVAVATRVRIPSLRIDLPIISGDLQVRGNPNNYPLCDVAHFLPRRFRQPSEEGTTYIYAHAQSGMFLPLLEASRRRDGASMLGALVQIYTEDGTLYLYEVFRVKRHAVDFALADEVPAGEQRLVLQTSEGPKGTVPKLQVAARLLGTQQVSEREANPRPRPRVCA